MITKKRQKIMFLIIVSFLLIIYCSYKIIKIINQNVENSNREALIRANEIYERTRSLINRELLIYERDNEITSVYIINNENYYKINNVEIFNDYFTEYGKSSIFTELNIVYYNDAYYVKDYSQEYDNVYSGYNIVLNNKLNNNEFTLTEYSCNGIFDANTFTCEGSLKTKKYKYNLKNVNNMWLIDKYTLLK